MVVFGAGDVVFSISLSELHAVEGLGSEGWRRGWGVLCL